MFKSIRDFNVSEKKVLVRCDFNVPIDGEGNILDDFRIVETLPTIEYLIKNNAKTILISHLKDPEGKVVDILRFNKIQQKLSELLNTAVKKAEDCIGQEVKELVYNLKSGEVLLLENLRFHKEEIENNLEFAKEISLLADIYINDAFGVDHRNHASIISVPKFLPHGAGLLLEKEIAILDKIMKSPEKPMIAIIGGQKAETKVKLIDKISEIADFVIISGLIKKEVIENKIKFNFPDKIIGPESSLDNLDINEKTIKLFREKIKDAKTILWNGPFGKIEDENYKNGTMEIAMAIIKSKAYAVVGGGETIEFLNNEKLLKNFSYVCTGGGAMLQYLSGDKLPGIEALDSDTY
ncbi:MAG: phosphoglycerate kinase [Candidatus Staskawiczbacteria bacterium]|nr:phosphoglycerate kinase [Candidatus Staskawiczbacteria bacterium]